MLLKKQALGTINKKQTASKYIGMLTLEVEKSLRESYELSEENIKFLIGRFSDVVKRDARLVPHRSSDYWAKFLVEASGLIKPLKK